MRILFLILLIGLSTFIQSWWGFSIYGVKPNLALISVITASFFVFDIWQRIFLVVMAALILKFAPVFENEILIFCLIGAGAILAKKYLPWQYFFGNLILIALGTLIFYVFLMPDLIISSVFVKELVLNLISGALIFAFLNFLWQNK